MTTQPRTARFKRKKGKDDRRVRKIVCLKCGDKMLATSTRKKFTWFKCTNPDCGETEKVFPAKVPPSGPLASAAP